MSRSVLESSKVALQISAFGGNVAEWRFVPFTVLHQQQTQWSWAAVTASVASFYKNQGWTQCRVVSDRLGQAECCNDGSAAECNRPWFLDKALDRIGNLAQTIATILTTDQIRGEIDAGHPLGVRIGWPSGGGHFVMLRGYSLNNLLDVMDPWFGHSSVDYITFKSAYLGSGRWTHSYKTKAQRGVSPYVSARPAVMPTLAPEEQGPPPASVELKPKPPVPPALPDPWVPEWQWHVVPARPTRSR